ncbi:acetyl-CoA carboxylase biotin carboxyl carrier protein [[Clostridium] dakarense]|uniref:acetyl-CoA carboxylase biotin carboxyl carrier protein n=1 Tax=Faecalimicrobium dakarense TaxID=1301100 RepID=UPI0004B9CBF1|nr:acetyl-CoA carboxylase biotin carboxyl carrier protein [[Clostridium] dakarense]
MNMNEIKDLLKVIDQTNLEYVKLESSELKLEVSKQVNSINQNSLGVRESSEEDIIPKAYEYIEKNINNDDNLIVIEAPLMGTYYSSPSPEADIFVKVGDVVSEGDTLCILEAMKLMNEITSDIDGEIIEVLAKNEELVEYNQPLFKIKPL